MNIVLGSIADWSSQWRMIVNCDANKTELICFYTNTPELLPTSFSLGMKSVLLKDHSKVLGVVIDKNLNFKEQSKAVYNKLICRWVSLCRYCNRNWGMCQEVIIRIARTIIFSSCMFYASMVWMNDSNLSDLNSLSYKVAKSAVGAVFNDAISTLEVIVGIPPLQVQNRAIILKHYLKTIADQPNLSEDHHIDFICLGIQSRNNVILTHMKDVFRFLNWKYERSPDHFSASDISLLQDQASEQFTRFSRKSCTYTKSMINEFTEVLWQECLNNRFQLEGRSRTPVVSLKPLQLPRYTQREEEVLLPP